MKIPNIEYFDSIKLLNSAMTAISLLLVVLIFVVILQMKNHSKRMGWFMGALFAIVGGLSSEIMGDGSATYDLLHISDASYIRARVFYAIVAPLFALYFIETEREEGKKWDGKFWFTFNSLIAFFVIIQTGYNMNGFFTWLLFIVQYVIVIVMLLISSKDIIASLGFIIGTVFPIAAAFVGMVDERVRCMNIGLVLMLFVVLFIYQADVERALFTKEAELSESKVSLLVDQIHPHFIYNSLQQIALLCDEDAGAVKPAILNFSAYLRRNLESLTNVEMIPFEKEMEHVDMFIELARISQSRYFEVIKSFEITDFYVPAITVQPIVENAIKYGIGMSTDGNRIVIETKEENGYIVISVTDDGHGIRTELPTQKEHRSVGTKNVMTRLKIMCDGTLTVNRNSDGTEAVIKIPIVDKGQ